MIHGLLTWPATVDRVLYFQECLEELSEPIIMTDEEVAGLIQKYDAQLQSFLLLNYYLFGPNRLMISVKVDTSR